MPNRLGQSSVSANLSLVQLQQKLSLLQVYLMQYGIPQSPTPAGIAKLNFICKLKLRLYTLPSPNAGRDDIMKVFDSLLDFLEPEIIAKQLRRERMNLFLEVEELHHVNVDIADGRLVAIARKLFPEAVERIEALVADKCVHNKLSELLILILKDYSPFDYLMAYTMNEHLVINRLKNKLDKNYYSKRQSSDSNNIVKDFLEYVSPEVYRNKLLREGGENIDHESATIGVARSLFPHRVNEIEKSAKEFYIGRITRRRLDSH